MDDATAARVVERVKELEHRGYQFEAADGSFDLLIRKETGDYEPLFRLESWRAIVEKRADGRVETEATIKIWVDGERYVRTAEGNGPVHALDHALREAIGERYPHLRDIELVNFKVRILDETEGTGAVTRVLLDASDGTDTWGSIGVSENIIEASWEALVDSLEAGMLPAARAAGARQQLRDPARQAARRRARGGARAGDAALGRLALGPRLPEFEPALAAPGRSPGLGGVERDRRASPGDPGRRRRERRRGRDHAVLVRGLGQLPALRERQARVLRHRPAHAQHRPAAAQAAVTERTTGLLPVHIFGYPADMPAFEALAGAGTVARRGRLRGARRASTPTARGGRARQPRGVRLLPEQAGHHGRGGAVVCPDEGSRSASTPSATRAARPDMGWLDHDRLGFNYRLDDLSCALGVAQLERLDELLPAAPAWPRSTEALAGRRGADPALPDAGGDRRSWFVYVVQLPRGSTATRPSPRCASAAWTPSRTCPPST